MSHRATLRLAFASEDEARRMLQALSPENGAFLSGRVEGRALVLDAAADSPLGLLHTLDDALACLGAAERAARVGRREGS